ncbi:hypothetical protein PAXINDRAFT_14936 [Paxillus involutus ATCC 200175]|uniref:Unplaced genomic scaffold PAXINscaffold_45, whole genome shotgun sequence n=1 Tax=Paxillus involutus ATCC 200175 TaxID=664439 RepID=A0A0C9TX16_PAXIN|nr:hypothetical protein PAXINDRAFT_14936 [Paxillus involutus ATCC 200175]
MALHRCMWCNEMCCGHISAASRYRPVLSFDDARTVDSIVHDTFQEATTAMGLFSDQNEAQYAMQEAVQMLKTPHQLHLLFIHLLVNDCIIKPIAVWNAFHGAISQDYALSNGHNAELALN